MSHIRKTYEEVLSLGTFNEEENKFTFDNLVLKDALINLYGKAFSRGVQEFSEGLDRVREEKVNEAL